MMLRVENFSSHLMGHSQNAGMVPMLWRIICRLCRQGMWNQWILCSDLDSIHKITNYVYSTVSKYLKFKTRLVLSILNEGYLNPQVVCMCVLVLHVHVSMKVQAKWGYWVSFSIAFYFSLNWKPFQLDWLASEFSMFCCQPSSSVLCIGQAQWLSLFVCFWYWAKTILVFSMSSWLSLNSLCRLGWSWTNRNPPASASSLLRLKVDPCPTFAWMLGIWTQSCLFA